MKHIRLLLIASLVSMTLLSSCTQDDDAPEIVVNPTLQSRGIAFDKSGETWNFTDKLSSDIQKIMAEEVLGHGWKWVDTHEILLTGEVCQESYWADKNGGMPYCVAYYLEANKVTSFYKGKQWNGVEYAFYTDDITTDFATGVMSREVPNNQNRIFKLGINTINVRDGVWHITVVENISFNTDPLLDSLPRFGISEYVRMTDDELQDYRNVYNYDLSTVIY